MVNFNGRQVHLFYIIKEVAVRHPRRHHARPSADVSLDDSEQRQDMRMIQSLPYKYFSVQALNKNN
jgi:hypothetical protein